MDGKIFSLITQPHQSSSRFVSKSSPSLVSFLLDHSPTTSTCIALYCGYCDDSRTGSALWTRRHGTFFMLCVAFFLFFIRVDRESSYH